MNSSGNFKASRWLLNIHDNRVLKTQEQDELPGISFLSSTFKPSDFFIPGWKGEGLISSSAIQIKNAIQTLTNDARGQYKTFAGSNRSLKLSVFNEFNSFLSHKNLDVKELKNFNDFWNVFQIANSHQELLEEFETIYCFRAVAIYLFRIKFLLELSHEIAITPTEDNLINPLSFLGKIFKKDSSTELNCECLSTNQYSWYRPSFEYKIEVVKLRDQFKNITLTELIKIFSTTDAEKIYSMSNYSHSLSHLSMGLLINELAIQMPKWIDRDNFNEENKSSAFLKSRSIKVLNTLFAGKNVSSLALSHWLAQDHNMKRQWDHLISPEFKGHEFIEGPYLKICQELQFLSFLAKVACEQGHEVIPFICKVMKEKYLASSDVSQASFFQVSEITGTDQETIYDRIVLNLIDLPKTNPHFYVVGQLLSYKDQLKNGGRIILFTNQKIFVPSQSEKVEQLLKDFKIECQFNLENLVGKGEIAQYVMILSRRRNRPEASSFLFQAPRELKETCHSFELSGELTRFNKFHHFVEELKTFLKNKKLQSTPIYQKSIDTDLNFDYHIDAIVEGKLLSSTTKDSGPKLHSNFFKSLYKSCIGFENFFSIESINTSISATSKRQLSNDILGIKTGASSYPLILIVNYTSPTNIKLELVSGESYQAKLETYGTAFFSYFGLSQKIKDINLNVFREYFNSSIGHQVIQLQLGDGQSKLKAKIKSLLIPKFFLETHFLPEKELTMMEFYLKTSDELLSLDPTRIQQEFNDCYQISEKLKEKYAWHLLGLSSYFNVTLNNILMSDFTKESTKISFTNPLIMKPLIELPTTAVYPRNEDVFIEIKSANTSDLFKNLTALKVKIDENGTSSLVLKNQDAEIVEMYSAPLLIQFLKFILDQAYGHRVSDILSTLRIPKLSELQKLTNNYQDLASTFEEIKNQNENFIASILNYSMFNNE